MITLTKPAVRAHDVLPRAGSPHAGLAVLKALYEALAEGMTALRTYENSRARGLPHGDAITRAFKAGYNT